MMALSVTARGAFVLPYTSTPVPLKSNTALPYNESQHKRKVDLYIVGNLNTCYLSKKYLTMSCLTRFLQLVVCAKQEE